MVVSNDPHRFEFYLDKGIQEQVLEKLEASSLLDLTKGVGPRASGIYALYFGGDLVYVGKTSTSRTTSERTLRQRLSEHRIKISKRRNITLDEMQCRYLTFASDWWVFAAEYALMAHYQPEWNNSGFGSKIPGKGRPGTHRVSRWDKQFPPA